MHGHAGVAEHGFGPRRRHHDIVARLVFGGLAVLIEGDRVLVGHAIRQRIAQVPHIALDLDVFDFEVGDRGFKARVPVHQPLGAVDEAAVVKLDEDLDDGTHHLVVGLAAIAHGEALARPVGRGAEPAQLVHDGAAAFALPFPDALQELLAPHLAAAGLLALHELALDDHLRSNARMVGARLPQHVLAAHAVEADQDVLDRVVERVPDMQRAGDVWRRNDDGESLRTRLCARTSGKGLRAQPGIIDAAFHGSGFVSLFKHRSLATT